MATQAIRPIVGCFVLAALSMAGLDAAEPKTFLKGTAESSEVVVEGVPAASLVACRDWSKEQWLGHFSIHTVIGDEVTATSLWGDYSVRDDAWFFEPRYPLRPGVAYEIRVSWPVAGQPDRTWRIRRQVAAAPTEPTRLTAIYPTGDELPENLLKFYLHFSGPMSREEVYRRVRLLDEHGKPVARPFLELSQELWSPDGLRLTLYFDPGRIKRGLKPREFLGPALSVGKRYTLVVDPEWPDAAGKPLAATMTKAFRVKDPDETQPDPKKWRVVVPKPESVETLQVLFDEPLDAGMLVRVLQVVDPMGNELAGSKELGTQEREWQFRPLQPWRAGQYHLVVAATLEDLAGNSIGRPFEVDVFRPANPATDSETVTVPFEVR